MCTLWYRGPELLLGEKHYTAAVDVWSLGCIYAEMARGTALFCGDSEVDQIHRIFRVRGLPSADAWPGALRLPMFSTFQRNQTQHYPEQNLQDDIWCPRLNDVKIDLLKRMLTMDPANRISAAEALRHPALEGVNEMDH